MLKSTSIPGFPFRAKSHYYTTKAIAILDRVIVVVVVGSVVGFGLAAAAAAVADIQKRYQDRN